MIFFGKAEVATLGFGGIWLGMLKNFPGDIVWGVIVLIPNIFT